MKFQGTLDSGNNFVMSTRPIVFQANGDITVQGSLNANGDFIAPVRPSVFSKSGANGASGTFYANGAVLAPSISAPVYRTTGDISIQGVMRANNFVYPKKPSAFQTIGDMTIQGTLDANGAFIAPRKPTVWWDDGNS